MKGAASSSADSHAEAGAAAAGAASRAVPPSSAKHGAAHCGDSPGVRVAAAASAAPQSNANGERGAAATVASLLSPPSGAAAGTKARPIPSMTPALKVPARARAAPHAVVLLVGTPPGEGALRSASSASDMKDFHAHELLQVGGAVPVAASVTTALTAAFIAVERIAMLTAVARLADAYVALCVEPSDSLPHSGMLGVSASLVSGGDAAGAAGRGGSMQLRRAGSSGGEAPRRPTSFIDNLLEMMRSAPDEIVEWVS